jgi:membrane carboxypeptidase/penicillin-binding protein PbpC
VHNPDCPKVHRTQSIELIYPVADILIWVPRNLQGEYEKVVFKAEYHAGSGPLYWYLNGHLLGETYNRHTIPADLMPGSHQLVVEDPQGSRTSVKFKAYKKGG